MPGRRRRYKATSTVGWAGKKRRCEASKLAVEIVSDREAHLVSEEGSRCSILQSVGGRWEAVTGQTRPTLQGWHSAGYGKWEPATTLIFHVPPGVEEVETAITLEPRR